MVGRNNTAVIVLSAAIINVSLYYATSNNVCTRVGRPSVVPCYSNIRHEHFSLALQTTSIMLQLLATRIIDDVIEDEMRRWDHVDSDVITAQRRSASDAGMTSREIQQMTGAHNARRRSVGATNMELMVHTQTHRSVIMLDEN